MKKAVFHLIVWLMALGALGGAGWHSGWWSIDAAQGAAGDLLIDWGPGILAGEPIFNVTDMTPGQMEIREVTVTNNDTVTRTVGVRATQTAAVGGISDALAAVVSVDGTPVYGAGSAAGDKTLTELFLDSAAPGALALLDLPAGDTVTIEFKVTFDPTIGNFFQNKSVTFDITLGLAGAETEIPDECGGDNFDLTGEIIIGTAGSDNLRGTNRNDVIFGLEGSDKIKGGNGNDCLVGGPGSDSLYGENGDDVLLGGADSDSLKGGNGRDELYGNEGTDSLKGENGPDRLFGNDGVDSLRGGNGNDFLDGGEGGDSLKGENGNDELVGGAGVDSAKGGSGFDICSAEAVQQCEG